MLLGLQDYVLLDRKEIGARVSWCGSETQKSTRNRRNEREVLSKDSARSKKRREKKIDREKEAERREKEREEPF